MQSHWDTVYSSKELEALSWYEESPTLSLSLIEKYSRSKDEAILDIGGGDSKLCESLLHKGFTNITVLDISAEAINRAKERMGSDACKVTWVVSDILEFKGKHTFGLIHDRAAFHFLLKEDQVSQYANFVRDSLDLNGHFIVGTFATDGPTQCSGLTIQRYSKESINDVFSQNLDLVESLHTVHTTPWQSTQSFVFSIFRAK